VPSNTTLVVLSGDLDLRATVRPGRRHHPDVRPREGDLHELEDLAVRDSQSRSQRASASHDDLDSHPPDAQHVVHGNAVLRLRFPDLCELCELAIADIAVARASRAERPLE
jgi:hypothetical protein